MQTKETHIGLLPAPSILKKLDDAFPGSASDVIARAERLQKQSFKQEKQHLAQQEKHLILRSVFRTFAPRRKIELPAPEENSIQKSWEDVGHFMRQAMRDFIETKKIDIESLNLTENEKADLFACNTPQAQPYKSTFS